MIAVFFLIALVGLRARWWQVALYLGLLAAEVLALWLIMGQSLGEVPEFLRNTYEIVSGFSPAMITSTDVPGWQVTAATAAAAVTALALVAASSRGGYRDGRARWAAVALMALAAFTVFKEGVVRTDAGHLSLFFSTACVLWIAIPWTRARWHWLVAGVAVIVAVSWPVRPEGQTNNLDPVANVEQAVEQTRTLFSGSRRQRLIDDGRESMHSIYKIEPRILAALRGHSVSIEPWEIGVAWAYRLDWEPLPVFQNYSAYTARLDRINSEALVAAGGPERLLRENVGVVYPEFPTRTIDNRYPGWDPPEQARTALCNFRLIAATERWQVLARVPDRCGPPRPLGTVEAEPGEAVEVPAPGPSEVVWARIGGVEVAGLERLASLLAHPRTRHAVLDGGERSYRLIPGTAEDGLLLRGSDGIGGKGAFAQIPQARTIAVTGVSGKLDFSFFATRVGTVRSRQSVFGNCRGERRCDLDRDSRGGAGPGGARRDGGDLPRSRPPLHPPFPDPRRSRSRRRRRPRPGGDAGGDRPDPRPRAGRLLHDRRDRGRADPRVARAGRGPAEAEAVDRAWPRRPSICRSRWRALLGRARWSRASSSG